MKRTTLIQLQFTDESSLQLRGRQSVRTTFKLTRRSIDGLSILANQLGIKQKTLFDHLVDDKQALKTIAEEATGVRSGDERQAKTYVVSRRTLEALEHFSKKFAIPRDLLVEYSIERIFPLLDQEKEKHGLRLEVASGIGRKLKELQDLISQAEERLGEDDPLLMELYTLQRQSGAVFERITTFLERSSRIEDL